MTSIAVARSSLLGALLALGITALTAPAAFAAECRASGRVQESADPDKNTALGGHLAQHIFANKKLPKDKSTNQDMSYKDKTAFKTKTDFQAAWQNYLKLEKKTTGAFNAATCSKLDGEGQTVTVAMLTRNKQDTIKGYSCKDAACSQKDELDFAKVAFFFRFSEYAAEAKKKGGKKKDSKEQAKGNWILVTAYPTN